MVDLNKILVFFSGRVTSAGAGATRVAIKRGLGAANMLVNCSHLVDVEAADAAVKSDKVRELGKIGAENFGRINQQVASALYSASVTTLLDVKEVNAASCGEAWSVSDVEPSRIGDLVMAAAVAGRLEVLVQLWSEKREDVVAYLGGEVGEGTGRRPPVWIAAFNGKRTTVKWLIEVAGAEAWAVDTISKKSALHVAAENGHEGCVEALLEAQTTDIDVKKHDEEAAALRSAAIRGHGACLEVLLAKGVDTEATSSAELQQTALQFAARGGHSDCVKILLAKGANVMVEDQVSDA